MAKLGCASCGGAKKMKTGGTSIPKAQKGKSVTPFQNYMKTPGAMASDTSDVFTGNRDGLNPKLDKAYYDTYYAGQENKRRKGADAIKYDAQGNRVGGSYGLLEGGAIKAKFGASVSVQHSPAPGRVRSASGVGTVPVGKRKMGTSSQMGFGKNGGTVKKPLVKAQMGKTVKTKPIPDDVYKRDSTNYANAANKYLNATSKKDFQVGADSLKAIKSRYGTPNALEKRMGKTTGGYGVDSVKKNGGSVKSFPDLNKDGKVTKADILKGRGVIKKKGGVVKTKKK